MSEVVLRVAAPGDGGFRVEDSSDLEHWTPIETEVTALTATLYEVRLPAATASHRFFRLIRVLPVPARSGIVPTMRGESGASQRTDDRIRRLVP
jgi:hypothetical protein